MNVSVAWLRALAPRLDDPPEELAARLSLQAVAVDAVEPLGAGLEDVIVARVRTARPHPDADRLTLCEVEADDGGETVEVVCGAPNVVEGATYPYVPPGGTLPAGFTIEKRKIRGVVSHGMLCSEEELGLGRDAAGILRLADDAEPGTPVLRALGLPDTRLALDLTPNRVDLASHLGVARELAPGGVDDLSPPGFGTTWTPEWADGETVAETGGVRVTIEAPDRCSRYLAAVVRGVRVGPSPGWLRARLRAAGARPINNVVDATNYVLLELGQPIHAFDLERLEGPEIRVRAARDGEELTTLDGQSRALGADVTVIADATRPVALAGVMGGEDSEVTADTTDLLIECAAFPPGPTRDTARATGLSTDASYRFERGIDPHGLEAAIRRCVELILAVAGGEAGARGIRAGSPPPAPRELAVRPSRVRRLLGLRLAPDQIVALLRPLGFEAVAPADAGGETALRLRVPTWRGDVTREVDVIEEVARRYGYERFPREPRAIRPSTVAADPTWARRAGVRRLLEARGFLEARGTPMVATARTGGARIELLHPLAATESALRTDLVPPLLDRLVHNFDHGRRDVRLYEIGTVFAASPTRDGPEGRDAFLEELRVGVVATGARRPAHWGREAPDFDVWDLRGWLEDLGDELTGWEVRPLEGPAADTAPREPGTAAGRPGFDPRWLGGDRFAMFVDGRPAGIAGRVAEVAYDPPPWAGPVYAAEFRLDVVRTGRLRRYEPRPSYPPVARDLALVTADDLAAARVEAALRAAGPDALVAVRPFDVYEGEGLGAGHRSVAWRLVFRAPDRTLTDEEVDGWVERIVSHVTEELDVRIRDA